MLGVPLFIVFGSLAGVLFGWLQLGDANPAVAGGLHSPLGWVVLLAAIGLLVATGRLPEPSLERKPRAFW